MNKHSDEFAIMGLNWGKYSIRVLLKSHPSQQSFRAFCSCMVVHFGLFSSRPWSTLWTRGLGTPFCWPRLTCRHSDSRLSLSLAPLSRGCPDKSSRVSPFSRSWQRLTNMTQRSRPVDFSSLACWESLFSATVNRKRTGSGREAMVDGRLVKRKERAWIARFMLSYKKREKQWGLVRFIFFLTKTAQFPTDVVCS